MDTVSRAAEVLRQAEANLRELASKAVTHGDYPAIMQIASWAQAIGDMAQEAAPRMSAEDNGTASIAPRFTPRPLAASRPAGAVGKKVTRGPRDEYPKFFRQGNQLLRIAWSKKEKKEYQHKAPHAVLQALAKAMAEAGKNGKVFSTDKVLPITDTEGSEIPAYQAYVCIALLKQAALLDQHGRQGYSIPRLAEFHDAIEAIWRKLPEQ